MAIHMHAKLLAFTRNYEFAVRFCYQNSGSLGVELGKRNASYSISSLLHIRTSPLTRGLIVSVETAIKLTLRKLIFYMRAGLAMQRMSGR